MRLGIFTILVLAFASSFGQGFAGNAALAVWGQSQLEFGDRPIPAAFEKGAEWGKSRTTKNKVEGLTQRGLSRWLSGISVQPFKTIELAWWLSPEYVSTRLGYLSAKEYWEPDSAFNRYKSVSERMQGKMVFFVQLASAPDYDILEDEFPKKSFDNTENRQFVLKINDIVLKPKSVQTVFQNVSRNPDILRPLAWYQFIPDCEFLTSEFEVLPEPNYYPLGDFKVKLVMIEFDTKTLIGTLGTATKLSLRVIGSNKERTAEWQIKH